MRYMKFTEYARMRMKEYDIPEKEVYNCITSPDELYLDILTGRVVAVKKISKEKYLITVYEGNDEITIVTLFPTSKVNKIEKRVKSGRWLEL